MKEVRLINKSLRLVIYNNNQKKTLPPKTSCQVNVNGHCSRRLIQKKVVNGGVVPGTLVDKPLT